MSGPTGHRVAGAGHDQRAVAVTDQEGVVADVPRQVGVLEDAVQVLDGASKTLDIEQFSIERFRAGNLIPTTRLI